MRMMKEGIFAGHPSLAIPPLNLASLALALLAHAHLPSPRSTYLCPAHPCKLKWQNVN